MKAHYRTSNGRLTFEVNGETAKDLFAQISSVQEIFEAEMCCGLCGCDVLRYRHRKAEDFDYYELACAKPDCGGRLRFGQAKKGGTLFPKRRDDDGNLLPNHGWSKYIPKDGKAAKDSPHPKEAGVPVFPSWQAAEQSEHWGEQWLKVAGNLYRLSPDGANYNAVKPQEAKRA